MYHIYQQSDLDERYFSPAPTLKSALDVTRLLKKAHEDKDYSLYYKDGRGKAVLVLDTSKSPEIVAVMPDEEWADYYELPLSVFLGKKPFKPIRLKDWYPCGYDDYLVNKMKEQEKVILLRRAWGRDSNGISFGEFVHRYWNNIQWHW